MAALLLGLVNFAPLRAYSCFAFPLLFINAAALLKSPLCPSLSSFFNKDQEPCGSDLVTWIQEYFCQLGNEMPRPSLQFDLQGGAMSSCYQVLSPTHQWEIMPPGQPDHGQYLSVPSHGYPWFSPDPSHSWGSFLSLLKVLPGSQHITT
jgi:hypothetical protein